jgi:hypothetical protein
MLLMTVLGNIYLREGLGKVATTKTGPNDVKRVVWAIRKFFFPFFCILISLMTVVRYYLSTGRRRLRKRAQTTPGASFGPLVSFFIHFFRILLLLTVVFRYYLSTGRVREGGDDENEHLDASQYPIGHLDASNHPKWQ